MGHVDVKVTVWQRLHFNDDTDMEKISKQIEADGGITNICDNDSEFSHLEWLDNTESVIHITDNQGISTIEVYEEADGSPIWQNGVSSIP